MSKMFKCSKLIYIFCIVLDIPTQVPPLTPGTNKKMTEALKASFASWEKEQIKLNITKGKISYFIINIGHKYRSMPYLQYVVCYLKCNITGHL